MLVSSVPQVLQAEPVRHIFTFSSERWVAGDIGAMGVYWRGILPAPSSLTPEVRISSSICMDWSAGWDCLYALNSAYLLFMIEPSRERDVVPYVGIGFGLHLFLYDGTEHQVSYARSYDSLSPIPLSNDIKVEGDRAALGGRLHIVAGLDVKLSSTLVATGELRFGIPRDPRFEIVAIGIGVMMER